MDPLVSVIIPAYNHSAYLVETIESVVAQDYPHMELLVVDDGSTDNTYEKLLQLKEKYCLRFVRFEVSTQRNCGLSATLNKLLFNSRGEYVTSTATDDKMKYNLVTRLVGFLEANKSYVMAVGDNEIIDSKSNRIAWDVFQNAVQYKSFGSYSTFASFLMMRSPSFDFNSDIYGSYEELLRGNHVLNGFVVRRSALLQASGYNSLAPLEDWYMALQLSKLGKIKFINEVLFSYRWHCNNSVRQKRMMEKYCAATLRYEIDSVYASGDNERIRQVESIITRVLPICRISNIFKVVLTRRIDEFLLHISLFNGVLRLDLAKFVPLRFLFTIRDYYNMLFRYQSNVR
jgi:alpha-1,3-rhamnosyltransferase